MTEHSADGSDAVTLRFGHEELVVRRRYEIASIVNDLMIALWFTVGSVLFFWESTATLGTLMFLLGSIQLAGRPMIRLHRRVNLRRFRPEGPSETARDF
ncbi:YrhK family protein [Saccharomonospora saliphila]|uniref:YrhK family protein n=1 Tax=Saccharomonospora saliphila TaxID=369829 RepID=UPI00037C18EC|nr:YrhK family protein [Saccharomonospora saliphila]